MKSRRELLKSLPACVAGAAVMSSTVSARERAAVSVRVMPQKACYHPLDKVKVRGVDEDVGLVVTDGAGREYAHMRGGSDVEFTIGGALGTHTVTAVTDDGHPVGHACLTVDCETNIQDKGGYYSRLLKMLRWTMESWEGDAPIRTARFNDNTYYFFVGWLRDHTHTLKGMKYFWPNIKSAVDLYADTQREDGMVFDNIYRRTSDYNYWDWILAGGKFILVSKDKRFEMHRQPVEADVEYLFVEAIYFTWKSTGDDEWMKSKLDGAIKAVRYSTSDPYRWSEKYQLVKRAYTIDTWDFVPEVDQVRGQNQVLDLKQTKFGVMYGDNTGLIAACRYLGEMLKYSGRHEDGARYSKLADELQRRLDALAWNGQFYRHHVSEDTSFVRNLGVNESEQVSLSNSYSLNRGASQERAAAIIRTYQRLRREMPKSSPGEFYAIYPPYTRGFDKDNGVWEYMNAGVLSIVAGELAHGAFEHGFEEYGADILRRQKEVAEKHGGYLPVVLRGKAPEIPQRNFETISLQAVANVDLGAGGPGVVGWLNEKDNYLENMPTGRQHFEDIPFDIVDPVANDRKTCLGLAWETGYSGSATVAVGKRGTSIYLLHSAGRTQAAYGYIKLIYQDGDEAEIHIDQATLASWWEPADLKQARVAWHGPNQQFGNVGVYVAGYANPKPDKVIDRIEFDVLRNGAKWLILGVTLSDVPVFFMPKDDVSFGIPDCWGAAAVVYALVEGLAGVKDAGAAFTRVQLSPRWAAAGVEEVRTTIRYAASNGYVAYRYGYDPDRHRLNIDMTGNAEAFEVNLLMPAELKPRSVLLDGRNVRFENATVEGSLYLKCQVPAGTHSIEIIS